MRASVPTAGVLGGRKTSCSVVCLGPNPPELFSLHACPSCMYAQHSAHLDCSTKKRSLSRSTRACFLEHPLRRSDSRLAINRGCFFSGVDAFVACVQAVIPSEIPRHARGSPGSAVACFLGRPLRWSGPGLALLSLSDTSLLQVDTPEESVIALKGVGSCAYASAQKEREAVPRNGIDGPRLAVSITLAISTLSYCAVPQSSTAFSHRVRSHIVAGNQQPRMCTKLTLLEGFGRPSAR